MQALKRVDVCRGVTHGSWVSAVLEGRHIAGTMRSSHMAHAITQRIVAARYRGTSRDEGEAASQPTPDAASGPGASHAQEPTPLTPSMLDLASQLELSIAHGRVQSGSDHLMPHGVDHHKPTAVKTAASGQQSVEGKRGLIDSVGFVPFLFPALLALASVAVFKVAGSPAAASEALPGWCIVTCLMPLFCMHIGIPVMDLLLGPQPAARKAQPSAASTSLSARVVPSLWAAAHILASMAAYAAASAYTAMYHTAGGSGLPAVALLLGVASGASLSIGNAAAHELCHGRHPVVQAAAQALLLWACNGHYSISHHHHHLHACTPADVVTARKGQTYWSYLPQYVAGPWRVAWEEEAAECARRGRGVWGPHNRVLAAVVGQVAVAALVWGVWGVAGLVVHLTAAAIAQAYFAAIDYSQHYGLQRILLANGRYSPLSVHSAYNSAYAVEGAAVFKALFHSDHHMAAAKPFGDLSLQSPAPTPGADGSTSATSEPFLPAPAAILMLLPFVPPLWFRVMDPLADNTNAQHALAVGAAAGTRA